MSLMVAFGMPAAFTREDVAKIASLAHLELDSAELDLFARQLADILGYAEQVQQIDTTGIPPTAGVLDWRPADRTDEVRASLKRDIVLAAAPDGSRPAGLFKVP